LLQDGGAASTPRSRLRDALVVAQLALSLILAIGRAARPELWAILQCAARLRPKGCRPLVYPREGRWRGGDRADPGASAILPASRARLWWGPALDLGGPIESQTFTMWAGRPRPSAPDVGQ